ncbi:TPA: hypothetical protein GRI54_05235 [Vibrio parahaemolyticus]|uniref:hypothetical protein n=1 Tax=Vibrio TaxID=662 RepID=UPI001A2E31F1|nr:MULTISPECIES: hypothetical protein [Vibrio]EIO5095124.1 hypothetical protein [Vibrio parahaemolyticus]MCG9742089.1 hypothetical protein [Vibrio alginolyticus]MDW2122302.1 hypothetical protein [Vibrio sp. 2033]HAS6547040.1 hypothetical protein [Vibrio parahaemolyticus]HAS6732840.1 hypothetical protein [Vibrio parahaemolyticus]
MSLDLYEKQLLRSISDVVARDPGNAKLVFEMVADTTENAAKLMADIEPIVEVVNSYQSMCNIDEHHSYIGDLSSAIDKLGNREARLIFKSSLEPDLYIESDHSSRAVIG